MKLELTEREGQLLLEILQEDSTDMWNTAAMFNDDRLRGRAAEIDHIIRAINMELPI